MLCTLSAPLLTLVPCSVCAPNSLPSFQLQEAVSDPPIPSCSISFSTEAPTPGTPRHATCGVGWVLSPASSEQWVTNMCQQRSPDRAPWDVQTKEMGQLGTMQGIVLELGGGACRLLVVCSGQPRCDPPPPGSQLSGDHCLSPFQNWDSAFGPRAGPAALAEPWRAHVVLCIAPHFPSRFIISLSFLLPFCVSVFPHSQIRAGILGSAFGEIPDRKSVMCPQL